MTLIDVRTERLPDGRGVTRAVAMCDGPGCNERVDATADAIGPWHYLLGADPPEEDGGVGNRHFHSNTCLKAWAMELPEDA